MNSRLGYGASIGEIKDGTSNTLAVSELVQSIETSDDSFGLWALGEANIITGYNEFKDPVAPLPPPATNIQVPNGNGNAAQNPNASWVINYTPYCDNNHAPGGVGVDPVYACNDSDGATTARSNHPGGVNAALCDGSVR